VTGCGFNYDVTTYHRLTISCDDGDDVTFDEFTLNLTPNSVSIEGTSMLTNTSTRLTHQIV